MKKAGACIYTFLIFLFLIFYPFRNNYDISNMYGFIVLFPLINPISIVQFVNFYLQTSKLKR